MTSTSSLRSRLLGSASSVVFTLGICGSATPGAQAAGLPFAGLDAAIHQGGVAPSPFVLIDDDNDDDDDDEGGGGNEPPPTVRAL